MHVVSGEGTVPINPSTTASLLARLAVFFHSLRDDPGGAVAKEELLALGLSPDYRHECGICDRATTCCAAGARA